MELHISGQKLDLSPGEVFAVTVQSNDITKPDSVQSSYSNTVQVPYSQRNNTILEHANEVASISDAPYVELEAQVLQDGVEVVPMAKAYLQSADDGYEVQVFSGAVDFFAKLGDKSIKELDLTRFNHLWNMDNVADGAGHFRTWADGYIYTLVSHGRPINRGALYPGNLFPSVFVKTIYAQLMAEAGVNWSFENATFDKMLLPFTNGQPVHSAEWVAGRQYTLPAAGNQPYPGIPLHYGEVEITLKLNVTRLYEGGTQAGWTIALEKGAGIWLQEPIQFKVAELGEQEVKATFKIDPIHPLEELSFWMQRENLVQDGGNTSLAWYTDGVITVNYKDAAYFNTEWSIADNLPDIKQKDFFKMVNALFNLMPNFDPYTSTMALIPMQQLEKNKDYALDWSDKLVYVDGKKPRIEYKFGDFGQKSWFRYAEGPAGTVADSYLEVENQQLEPEKTVLTLPVAASGTSLGFPEVSIFEEEYQKLTSYNRQVANMAELYALSPEGAGERVLVLDAVTGNNYTGLEPGRIYRGGAIYIRDFGFWALGEQEYTYKTTETKPRLVLHNPESRHTVTLQERGELVGRSLTMTASTFAGLEWENILNTYYEVLRGILYRCKGITAQFKLTAQDVQSYDASTPIWLDVYQSYFYLNSINEFTGEGVTECNLWRL